MERIKFLNIKGAVLDKERLKSFMEQTAANYEVAKYSKTNTYPIKRLEENYLFIEKTYAFLNEHIKQNIDIYPAGEWLLDNFYIIEETVKKIKKEMPLSKYKNLPSFSNGSYKGFARIYVLASLITTSGDNKIDDEILKDAILAYQKQKTLTMEEIWNISIFLEIAIIENIRGVCEKIISSQMQKEKVENIIERTIQKQESNYKCRGRVPSLPARMFNQTTNIKYPFIEYMSYKLKRYGKRGIAYLNILEDEVNKMGYAVEEAIKKEHFDIAIQKVLIGNSITSIREISRINFVALFEEINGVEEILKKDPQNVYANMDYKTKAYYRDAIKKIANKTKISENYIANKVLELAKKGEGKTNHIGYYLIDDGYNELIKSLGFGGKLLRKENEKKAKKYIYSVFIVSLIFSGILGLYEYNKSGNILLGTVWGIFAIIPISEIYIQMLNYLLVKFAGPKLIPKMDFSNGIPDTEKTIVVIPTIINSSKKVKELMHKLEVYYLANKSENLYFALLGDTTSSKNEIEKNDEEISKTGIEEAQNLNKKYGKKQRFFFLYRNRVWCAGEKCFLGWERKRGLLSEFNEFVLTGEDKFKTNTLKDVKDFDIKYAITLDSDTALPIDTASELIGAMAHILNKPEIENGIVKKGHAIIQPRVGVDIVSSRKTLFSKIFAGNGGTDIYANAISDVYQDNFDEGIYTGKGIYDINIFYNVLQNEIPDNMVLSHDLLEGSYLRTGLASDIFLLDGTPSKYNSYIQRYHRWTRGDWQLLNWLGSTIKTKKGKKQNPLNKLSKFKILDNLRRSLVPIHSLMLIILGLLINKTSIFVLGLISAIFPTILDLGNYIVFKKNEANIAYKNISKTIGPIGESLLKGTVEFLFLPNKVYKSLDAIAKSLYRMYISKQSLLEWTTSEDAEKNAKTSLISYFIDMKTNIILGILEVAIGILFTKILPIIVGILWIIGPYFAWKISLEKPKNKSISKEDKKYLEEIGLNTWRYFKDNINEKNNFLPPDNYQEDRKEKVANRTSPTNIGLRFAFYYICVRFKIYR